MQGSDLTILNRPTQTHCIYQDIAAADLAKALTDETTTMYQQQFLHVHGELNLKHALIQRPIELTNCFFDSSIEFCYAEFLQTVNLSKCIFATTFNSGNTSESFTIYRKDLICNGTIFLGAVGFNCAQVEGSAFYHHAMFLAHQEENQLFDVDFTGFHCARSLEFLQTTFKGRVSFNCIHCGDGIFRGCCFECISHDIDMKGATFDGNLEFEKDPLLSGKPTIFHGGLDCTGIRCGRKAMFRGVQFKNPSQHITFDRANFGWLIDCSEAHFNGPASFVGMHSAGDCIFQHTIITGPMRFNGATIAGDGCFSDAQFRYKLLVQCNQYLFGPALSFTPDPDTTNDPNPWDNKEPLHDEVDMRRIHVNGNLELSRSIFKGKLNLGQAVIQCKLRLDETKCYDELRLYDASIKIIELLPKKVRIQLPNKKSIRQQALDPHFPLKSGATADLTSCTFERFHAGHAQVEQALARRFADAQNPQKFSRDPYLQLEAYYQQNGQEQAARDIHLAGHKAIRHNACSDGVTEWSTEQKIKDWLLMVLTGWGLNLWPLVLTSIMIIMIGTLVFLPESTLTHINTPGQPMYITPDVPLHLLQRFGYSLDLFIPGGQIGYVKEWSRTPSIVYESYAMFHALMGWILIPLLIASLTGIIKSD